MTKYIARLVNVGLSRESSRGVAVAAAFWVPKTGVAFFDKALKHKSKLNYGVIGGEGNVANKVLEWAEGSVEGDIFDKSFGLLLYAAFGTLVTTGPSDSAYTHTFSIQNGAQHQSLTITLSDPDRTDQYALGVLDSLDLTLAPDDVVTYVAKFLARTGRAIATPTVTYTAQNKFLGRHAIIKIASVVGSLGAASALSIKSLKLKINKNAKANNILGTVWPEDILNTNLEITGEMMLDLDDQTYRQYMLDENYKALRIQLVNSDVLLGASSRPQFTLDLARVHFEAWEPSRSGNNDIVTQKITFTALFDITTSTVVNSCALINGQSSY